MLTKQKLDSIDFKVLTELQANGRIKNAALAKRIGLAESTTLSRIAKLEENDVILGYTAIIGGVSAGVLDQVVQVKIEGDRPAQYIDFEQEVMEIETITSIKRLTGRGRYLVRGVGGDLSQLVADAAMHSGVRMIAFDADAIALELKPLRGIPIQTLKLKNTG